MQRTCIVFNDILNLERKYVCPKLKNMHISKIYSFKLQSIKAVCLQTMLYQILFKRWTLKMSHFNNEIDANGFTSYQTFIRNVYE